MEKQNAILALSMEFALEIIHFSEKLELSRKYLMAKQLWRSGTAIGAHVREAQGCESRPDFIHKMKIAYKEAEETRYWLELCQAAETYPDPDSCLDKIMVLLRILGKILASSKSKR